VQFLPGQQCVQSSFFPKLCWKATYSDCRTLNYAVYNGDTPVASQVQSVRTLPSLPLVPQTKLSIDPRCAISLAATNVTFGASQVTACPVVDLSCENEEVQRTLVPCGSFFSNVPPVCPPSTPPAGPTDQKNLATVGRIIMWIAIALFIAAVAVTSAYFLWTRVLKKRFAEAGYQRLPFLQSKDADDHDDIDVPVTTGSTNMKNPFESDSDDGQ